MRLISKLSIAVFRSTRAALLSFETAPERPPSVVLGSAQFKLYSRIGVFPLSGLDVGVRREAGRMLRGALGARARGFLYELQAADSSCSNCFISSVSLARRSPYFLVSLEVMPTNSGFQGLRLFCDEVGDFFSEASNGIEGLGGRSCDIRHSFPQGGEVKF